MSADGQLPTAQQADWRDMPETRRARHYLLLALRDAATPPLRDALRARLAGGLLPDVPEQRGRLFYTCDECGEEMDGTPHYLDERVDVDDYRSRPCPGCTEVESDGESEYDAGHKRPVECALCGGHVYSARGWRCGDGEYTCGDACQYSYDVHEALHSGLEVFR